MNIYDEMKAAGVEIDSHESDLYVPVNDTTREIVPRYPDVKGVSTFIDNITKTQWYELPFQYIPYWDSKRAPEAPKWPPPRVISKKAYQCGACLKTFYTETNHWGDIYTCKNPNCGSTSRSICIEPVPQGYMRPAVRTIQTRIYYYRFNLRVREEHQKWLKLQMDLEAMHPGKCFMAYRDRTETLKDCVEPITLQIETLFNNQWLSTTSRVFDWYLGTDPGIPDIRAGHWLEITEEMRTLRHNTIECGYCGHQRTTGGRTPFHLGCLGTELLKEDDLALLRWRRIDDTSDREPLTDEERTWLVPLYRSRQIHGSASQARRAAILSKFSKAIERATTERDGMLWLLDRAIKLDNVIYYHHTGRFGFGCRTPLSAVEKEELKARLAEFPFPYDVK